VLVIIADASRRRHAGEPDETGARGGSIVLEVKAPGGRHRRIEALPNVETWRSFSPATRVDQAKISRSPASMSGRMSTASCAGTTGRCANSRVKATLEEAFVELTQTNSS